MTLLEETGAALARALGLDPQHRVCWGLACDFDSSDVARLRVLRDGLREVHPDIADTLTRHMRMTQQARDLLTQASPSERAARRESIWPLSPGPGRDFAALCDYLLDALHLTCVTLDCASQEERVHTMGAVIKAVFLELGACMGRGAEPTVCEGAVQSLYSGRLRRVIIDLAASRLTHSGNLEDALKVLTQSTTSALEAEGSGVWLIDERAQKAERITYFSVTGGMALYDASRPLSVLPFSLMELEDARVLCLQTPSFSGRGGRLREVCSPKITSLLAAPIRLGARVRGFIAFEHESDRLWTPEDRRFAEDASRIAGMALEASDRRRTNALQQLQVSALGSVPSMMLIAGRDGRVVWANLAMEQGSGYSARELEGRSLTLLRDRKGKGAFYRTLWERVSQGQAWRGKAPWQSKDGRVVNRCLVFLPMRNMAGEVSHVLITEDHLPRKSLRRAVWKIARRGLGCIPKSG